MWRHEKQLILKAAHTYGIRTYRTRTLLFLVNYVPYAYAIFCCNVRSNFDINIYVYMHSHAGVDMDIYRAINIQVCIYIYVYIVNVNIYTYMRTT